MFKLDYLQLSTNLLLPKLKEQLEQGLYSSQAISDRFYSSKLDFEDCTILTGRKNRNLRHLYIRYRHDYLSHIEELPRDANLTRVDICKDFDTIEEALKCVTLSKPNKYRKNPYGCSSFIQSYNDDSEYGATYYFGSRTSQFYERVYWKIEISKWRYEVEIKPNSKTLSKKMFQALAQGVQDVYTNLEAKVKYNGIEMQDKLEGSITERRQIEIDFVLSNSILNSHLGIEVNKKIIQTFSNVELKYAKRSITKLMQYGKLDDKTLLIYICSLANSL